MIGRKTNLLFEKFRGIQNEDEYQEVINNGKKKLILRFLLKPEEVLFQKDKVSGMRFSNNMLEGAMNEQKTVTDEELGMTDINAQLIIKSVGQKMLPLNGVSFDSTKNVIPSDYGCVLDTKKQQIPGLYVAGWAKRGSNGIIDATLRDTRQTFGIMKHHLDTDLIKPKATPFDQVSKSLPLDYVSYSDWCQIDNAEITEGSKLDKIREKYLSRNEMIN